MSKIFKNFIVFLLGCSFLLGIAACQDAPQSDDLPPIEDVAVDDGINENSPIGYLVENGETAYKVVYPVGAESAVNFAMSELSRYLGEATGVNLKILPETSVSYDEHAKYISVGNTELSEKAGIEVTAEQLNQDGFVIKTVGENLYIKSANNRGIIYGVYDFLEKYLGVRFISSDITYVPETDSVQLYETDIVSVPAFEFRNLYSNSMRMNDEVYARMRFNAPEREISDLYGGRTSWYTKLYDLEYKYEGLHQMLPHYAEFNVIHNAFYFVDPSVYAESHPEFFARDEQGNIIKDVAGSICQLNLLNGIKEDGTLDESMDVSVAKVALESLKSFILDDPEAEIFFFGHNDWNVWDRTPETVAAEEKYGGQSGILMRFVNMLSREIEKWMNENGIDREIKIATWAYLFTKDAPVKEDGNGGWEAVHPSVIPEDNIIIRIAPIELDWYYSVNDPNQIEGSEYIEQWTYLTDNFMFWTYETNFGNYLYYHPSMRQWSDNLHYFRDIGTQYVMMQDNYHGYGSWQADMHTYVASKLLWNPDIKLQPLVDEFLYHYFGENGGKAVAEMMQIFDDHFAILQAIEEDFWVPFRDDAGDTLYNSDYFPITLLNRAENIIKEALAYNQADETIDDTTRNMYDRNLTSALLTPQMMTLKNYAKYYDTGRTAYASEFITNAEYAGVNVLSEVQTLINYKAELGLADL